MTKVGLWYVLFAVLVGVAATNTGNNALYIVLAVMLALLVVSGFASRFNLRRLRLEIEPPGEVFANRPFALRFSVYNESRYLPHFLLLFSLTSELPPRLVPHLPRGATSRGVLEVLLPRRGRHRFAWAHLASLFPAGFFHKGLRYPLDVELLVYPEIYSAATRHPEQAGELGAGHDRRAGWGHDLHSLRSYRQGDDPRGIHWKQTARVGDLIFKEREAEQGRRLSILFDNAVGDLGESDASDRFERLVSEAATAAVDYLKKGYEVELKTRDVHLPFAAGLRQRRSVLETLALVSPVPRCSDPLRASDERVPHLSLAMEPVGSVA
jgi:uncharacterized protein (DUF58 family)